MKTFYYYKVLRKIIIQFLDLFNDINIAKYDDTGAILRYIKVPVKLAPKMKTYLSSKDNKNDKVFPIISVILQDIAHDAQRKGNANYTIKISNDIDTGVRTFMLPGVPYNFTFNLSILSNYIIELDQILEQILPFFNPDTMIRIKIPELGNIELECKVMINSIVPTQFDPNMSAEDYRIMIWDLTFVVYGWLFKPIDNTALIKDIGVKLYTTEDSWENRSTETEPLTAINTSGEASAFIKDHGIGYDEEGRILHSYEIFED